MSHRPPPSAPDSVPAAAQAAPLRSLAALPPIDVAETLRAQPGVVDLWCFPCPRLPRAADQRPQPAQEDASLSALDRAYLALLTADERARHDRYLFERDRLLFRATRALARTVLSQYAAVAPIDWRFAAGSHGRPYIDGPRVDPPLHFNLSNAHGMVVCAVSVAHAAVGADTEAIDRVTDTVAIADHYFSPREVQALHRVPAPLQAQRFFAYWTLKESYIKARGLGLALPLEQFSFLLDEGPDISIAFDPRLVDDPARWRFCLLRGSPHHFIAVGVDTGGAPLSLRAARFVPLQGPVPFAEDDR